MKLKRRGVLLLISFIILPALVFAEEKLTITTYYPSPYGSYRELRAKRMAIGEDYIKTDLATGYCWGGGCLNAIPDPNPEGHRINLVVQDHVGIGTFNPRERLQVNGRVIFNPYNLAHAQFTTVPILGEDYVRIVSDFLDAGKGALRFDQDSTHFFTMWTEGTDANVASASRLFIGHDGTSSTTSPPNAQITIDGDNRRLGIGTVNPQAKLDVTGDGDTILVPRKSTAGDPNPTGGPINGMIYYNSNSNTFRCYKNGGWSNCGAAASLNDYEIKAVGTDNSVTTDGFVIAYTTSVGMSACQTLLEGRIGDTCAAATPYAYASSSSAGASHPNPGGSFTMPVRAGKCWRVNKSNPDGAGDCGLPRVYWVPLQ